MFVAHRGKHGHQLHVHRNGRTFLLAEQRGACEQQQSRTRKQFQFFAAERLPGCETAHPCSRSYDCWPCARHERFTHWLPRLKLPQQRPDTVRLTLPLEEDSVTVSGKFQLLRSEDAGLNGGRACATC